MEKFDSSQISLYDTSEFWEHVTDDPELEKVDAFEYLQTIKNCRWHGPYKSVSPDTYFFITIDDTG